MLVSVQQLIPLKALCKRGHIVADTNVSPFTRARNICCGHKFCVRDTKNVFDFVQKHFVSATNVSQFAQPKKHHEQQCVRNSVALFASTFTMNILCPCRDDFSLTTQSCYLLSTILVLCPEDDKLDFFLSHPRSSPLG